jgi:exopolysaccharide biosynthesis polyprenyl glycosylphosphotransferase
VTEAARVHPTSDAEDVVALPASEHGAPPSLAAPGRAPPRPTTRQPSTHGLFAWMLVVPVDVVALMAPALVEPRYTLALATVTGLVLCVFLTGERHRAKLHLSVLDELPYLLGRLLSVVASVAFWLAFVFGSADVTATGFLRLALPAIGLFLAGRVLTTAIILSIRRHRLVVHRAVLVGGGQTSAELATLLARYPEYGVEVVGFVDDGARCAASAVARHLGAVSTLGPLVAVYAADVLLVADGSVDEDELQALVRTPACSRCALFVVPRMHSFQTRSDTADHVGSIPVLRIRKVSLEGPAWIAKRVADAVTALLALVLLSPLLAACALAVRIDGGPGVIFRQQRVGRDGHLFDCLKFRSMRPASVRESSTQWSIAQDHRLRPVGRFLRRTSLDELPQLWNVVRGDMAMVGPRPERPHFVEEFSEQYGCYGRRHRVRVGLTGLAQVSGLRGDTPIGDRARFDNYYIENWSFWLDIKILIRTVGEVIRGGGR